MGREFECYSRVRGNHDLRAKSYVAMFLARGERRSLTTRREYLRLVVELRKYSLCAKTSLACHQVFKDNCVRPDALQFKNITYSWCRYDHIALVEFSSPGSASEDIYVGRNDILLGQTIAKLPCTLLLELSANSRRELATCN